MSDLDAWYCDEHGPVLRAAWTGSVEFSILHFCPVCGKEARRRGVLSEIEGPSASSYGEWEAEQELRSGDSA